MEEKQASIDLGRADAEETEEGRLLMISKQNR
jgi:hypothetical protein